MDLNLGGQSVTRVCFDASFTILTSGDCELRIETESIIKTPAGDMVTFDPESPGNAAIYLTQLVRESVTSAEVGSVGNLRVAFGSGAELAVAPHIEYEAWGLVGPKERRVTCMPGGEVALWSERNSS
ncbi:DUF6188 family protein [Micromonospora sp. WMMD1082]|uniref:DUF6188 family protein n=1 Tax=Micromonospora sp. WMMD1082 TaxID=3016104 RepID=UPI002415BC7B|nr:DUF6188 family protein [Micromonospora sp. WMMD1082]MDG4794966.1 DUF6188 family protein [Micromonospora sp. WMMD1082]